MRKKRVAGSAVSRPVERRERISTRVENDGVFYYAEPDTGIEQLWRTDSQAMEEGEAPVMYGWFSLDNLYFGDMELSMMPIQVKVRAKKIAEPRKIERFSLFYQSDSCFHYAIPGEGAERA